MWLPYMINLSEEMKNVPLCVIFSMLFSMPCFAQNKILNINFPDSVKEKEIIIHYSIGEILNYFYEPYLFKQKTHTNNLSVSIPDSVETILLEIFPTNQYEWGKNVVLYMNTKGQYTIDIDSVNPPLFRGGIVCLASVHVQFKKW